MRVLGFREDYRVEEGSLEQGFSPSDEVMAVLLPHYVTVGYLLAEEGGARFGLVLGSVRASRGFAVGPGPRLAAGLAGAEIPGYVGFYSRGA